MLITLFLYFLFLSMGIILGQLVKDIKNEIEECKQLKINLKKSKDELSKRYNYD